MKRYRCPREDQLEEFPENNNHSFGCRFCGFEGVMSYTEKCHTCHLYMSFCPKCRNIICLQHGEYIKGVKYSRFLIRDEDIELRIPLHRSERYVHYEGDLPLKRIYQLERIEKAKE